MKENIRVMLTKRAWEIRLELIRMFSHGKAHHFGGSLSCAELLSCLYFYKMRYDAANSSDQERDRFVMSKGHSVPTQYVVLALLGLFPREELATIKQLGSRLQGHPDINKTPGVEAPTGSLGQGLSFANGVALAGRLDGRGYRIYVLMGDGELQEGQVWEAAMTTAHYGLNNVCVLVDRNRFQSQGEIDAMMGIEPLAEKWRAFGWDAEVVDGHDVGEICTALDRLNGRNRRPLAIVANTVKGKGVSFLEGTYKYHNYKLTEEEYKKAELEILTRLEVLDG
jgi:transketolase